MADRGLTEQQYGALFGGGVNDDHYHEERITHETMEKLQSQRRIIQTTVDYTPSLFDDVIIAVSSSADVIVTLPVVTSQKEYTVVKGSTLHTVLIHFAGGANCLGSTEWQQSALGAAATFKAYQGNWIIVGNQ